MATVHLALMLSLLALFVPPGYCAVTCLLARRRQQPAGLSAADDVTGLRFSAPGTTLRELDRALARTPLDPTCFVRRGRALLDLGRYDEAGVDFLRARALAPALADGAFGLACVEAGRGRHDVALGFLAEAAFHDPGAIAAAAVDPSLRVLGSRLSLHAVAGSRARTAA